MRFIVHNSHIIRNCGPFINHKYPATPKQNPQTLSLFQENSC